MIFRHQHYTQGSKSFFTLNAKIHNTVKYSIFDILFWNLISVLVEVLTTYSSRFRSLCQRSRSLCSCICLGYQSHFSTLTKKRPKPGIFFRICKCNAHFGQLSSFDGCSGVDMVCGSSFTVKWAFRSMLRKWPWPLTLTLGIVDTRTLGVHR